MADKRKFTAYRHREHADETYTRLCPKPEGKDIWEAHNDG